MMFASLILEREPLQLELLPVALLVWLRDAGIIAAFGLAIWGLAFAIQRPAWARAKLWTPRRVAFATLAGLAAGLYVIFILLLFTQSPPSRAAGALGARGPVTAYSVAQNLVLTAAGACAVFAVLLPVVLDLFGRFRWRRIWALARLSIKEARSKGVIWICLIIPIIYLYADWYLTPAHPKDHLAQRVKVAYFALTLLFVISAVFLGSFSIPTDIKNQTIHTIVTKPVERYEIVLGRFIGYASLLFLELLVLTALSIFYVTRGMTPDSADESYKARVPMFAEQLRFARTKDPSRGESVGREWEYRSYINSPGPQTGGKPQYAIWRFQRLPGSLADPQKPVRVEYSFDIFRTTKGNEQVQGVLCRFIFAPGNLGVVEVVAKVSEWEQKRNREQKDPAALAAEMGIHVAGSVVVHDYRTLPLKPDVPAALFKKLYAEQDNAGTDSDGQPAPALQILVSLEHASGPQLLGVARRDLYVLAAERSFEVNFLKGSIALWMGSCLVLGIALACSTYLSGIISLLATGVLCGLGLFQDFIRSVALGIGSDRGPFESAYRLAERQGGAVQLDRGSTTVNVIQALDDVFRWWLRLVLNAIPDVTRYDLTAYVASGFDISWGQVLFADTLIPLLGYLVPCAVLAYYLINSKEIANPS